LDNNKKHQKLLVNSIHLDEPHGLLVSRIPTIIWVLLIYMATITMQTTAAPLLLQSLFFSGIIVLHIALHWFASIIITTRPWIYFVIQGMLVSVSVFLIPNGFPAALIGLFPVLIGQSIAIYFQLIKVLFVSLFLYTLFLLAFIFVNGLEGLVFFISILILNTTIVVAYATLFFRQVHARIRTQTFLRELELTHQQVEELTLANERQRMARDLHDTLAQGLAGLIMQLEAVDAHLCKGNSNRAHEIVHQSMDRARKSLAEARQAIDNLRSTSVFEFDFTEAVREEIQRFTNATSIQISLDMKIRVSLSRLIIEHGLYIISECLTNIARHSQAHQVWVTIRENADHLNMEIKDDGKGFHTSVIGKQSGHYGLLGIYERARLIGGKLTINSAIQEGTSIKIEVPLGKEDII
jgi:NarL family two-component system sensor histidine kinase YdfH